MFKVFILYNSKEEALYIGIAEESEKIAIKKIQQFIKYRETDLTLVDFIKNLTWQEAREKELEVYNMLISDNPSIQRSSFFIDNIKTYWTEIKEKLTNLYEDKIEGSVEEENYFKRLSEIEALLKKWKENLPKSYHALNQKGSKNPMWKKKHTELSILKMKLSLANQKWKHTKWKSEAMSKRNTALKGKTYEEIYGVEKANKIREKYKATRKANKEKKKKDTN